MADSLAQLYSLTFFNALIPGAAPGCISGRDRSDQPTIFMTRLRIGQHRKRRLGSYFWKRFCEEVRRSHAGLHRAERVLDCLSTLTYRFRVGIKALLHGLEKVLMLVIRRSGPGVHWDLSEHV
jgi:hypothetical protein